MPTIPIYIRDEIYDDLVKEGLDVKKIAIGFLEERWQEIKNRELATNKKEGGE